MNQTTDTPNSEKSNDYKRLSKNALSARLDALLSIPAAEQPLDEVQFLLHELLVHEIELEIQNRELREAQERLEEVRDRYADLYDFAPVGFLTLDSAGKILNINLRACVMLGGERAKLLNTPLVAQLAERESRVLFRHLHEVFQSQHRAVDELRLKSSGNAIKTILLKSSPVHEATGEPKSCNSALIDITQQKQAEEALRAERDRAQGYLDTVEAMIVALDNEGRITLVNRKGCEILGYNEHELIGKNWFTTCLPASVRGNLEQQVFRDLITGHSRNYEYLENPVLTRSGEERLIAWHNSVLTDAKANVIGLLSAGEDITQRRQAEEDLHKLDRAVEQSPAIVVITDAEGNTDYVNPAFSKITGYSAEELQGNNPRILHSFVAPDEEFAAAWKTISRGKQWLGKYQNRKKNGEYYWEATSILPVRNAYGVITHFLALKEDITQQKYQEIVHEVHRCLNEQLLRRASLEDALSQMIIAAERLLPDMCCSIYAINKECTSLHLLAAPGLPDEYRSAFSDIEIEPQISACFKVAMTGEPSFVKDVLLQPYSQAIRELIATTGMRSCWAEPILSPLRDMLGIFSVYHHEPREPTATDKQSLSDLAFLAGIAIDHTQREEQDRLHQAELAHMARLNTMGEMATTIAHELNQPLSAISTYAAVALRMLQSGNMQQDGMIEALNGARDQAMRASEVIRHIRQFVSKRPVHKESVDINVLIEQILKLVQPDLHQHKVKVELHLAENLPPVMADQIQIEQVILNILRNCMEAMKDTDSTARKIRIVTDHSDTALIKTAISDTGPGIDAKLLSRIFDPFMTTKEGSGMGVGLSICRSIIENHDGRLWAESQPGHGASFFFTLPVILAK